MAPQPAGRPSQRETVANARKCFGEFLRWQASERREPTAPQWRRQWRVLLCAADPLTDAVCMTATVGAAQAARHAGMRPARQLAAAAAAGMLAMNICEAPRFQDRECCRWVAAEMREDGAVAHKVRQLWGSAPPPEPPRLHFGGPISWITLSSLRASATRAPAALREELAWFDHTEHLILHHGSWLSARIIYFWSLPMLRATCRWLC
eukprot:TRINITY_DN15964_c0_g2_i1.p1 TRINITY_DN15964_c0_g2~~TRINITY_DN15964_c0_g2_i1.p1  ORF type:complete len:233 (+),score=47.24 TRINITY_DN15964_c0_g2_i1:81-701(+)